MTGRLKKFLGALRRGWEAESRWVRYGTRWGVAAAAMTGGAIGTALWRWWHG